MNQSPISNVNIETSLFGIGSPRYDEPYLRDADFVETKEVTGSQPPDNDVELKAPKKEIKRYDYTSIILITVISAIIFITAVAIYDVIRIFISNHFSSKVVEDPNFDSTEEEATREKIKERYSLISGLSFALFSLIVAIILIPLIVRYLQKRRK